MCDREYWIRLPFPVSVNEIIGKTYKPARWEKLATLYEEISRSVSEGYYLTGSIHITYYFQKDDFKSYDIENFVKLAADAFTRGFIWGDDSQIDDSRQVRCRVGDPGEDWVFVHIREVNETPFLIRDRDSRSPKEIKERAIKAKKHREDHPKPKKRRRAAVAKKK